MFTSFVFAFSIPLRLKARKFQLVSQEPSLGTTGFSSTPIPIAPPQLSGISGPPFGSRVHGLMSMGPAPSTSLALSLPEPPMDPLFDEDVERLRKGLEGSDLKRKLALLREVWAREIAHSGEDVNAIGSNADTGEIPVAGNTLDVDAEEAASSAAVENRDSYDPHRQKRSRARGLQESDCAHLCQVFNDLSLDDEAFNERVNLCVEIALTYSGKPWPADALERFKLNYPRIEMELHKGGTEGKCLVGGEFNSMQDLPPLLAMAT